MDTEKKLEIMINLLPLIPLVVKGVTGAVETFDKMTKALKDGNISDDEWAIAIAERDALLDSIIEKTEG